jgi:hypothetical protein
MRRLRHPPVPLTTRLHPRRLPASSVQDRPSCLPDDKPRQPRIVVPKPVLSIQPAMVVAPHPAKEESAPSRRSKDEPSLERPVASRSRPEPNKMVINKKTGVVICSRLVLRTHVLPKQPPSHPSQELPSEATPVQRKSNIVNIRQTIDDKARRTYEPQLRSPDNTRPELHGQAVKNTGCSAERPKDSSEGPFEHTRTCQDSILLGEEREERRAYVADKINKINTHCSPEPSTALTPSNLLSASPTSHLPPTQCRESGCAG